MASTTEARPRTLLDKIWDAHLVTQTGDSDLIYIDLHLTHEVTTPQAFEGLRLADRPLRRPDLTIATADHDVPTDTTIEPGTDTLAGRQLRLQRSNCEQYGIQLHPMNSAGQGIVHVIGPERGLTLPGMTIVCGDSHTSTHGAFGALAFGIGTSQVEHVMATQTLPLTRPRSLLVTIDGELPHGSVAKDLALALLAQIGTDYGTGHIIEFAGSTIASLSMEARMTLCNLAIEAGARGAIIAPDPVTIDYVRERFSSSSPGAWEQALADWQLLHSDAGARHDREVHLDASQVTPRVSWGIKPSQSIGFEDSVPGPDEVDPADRDDVERALAYTGLRPGQPVSEVEISTAFIGSCTNGRIEDFRDAARMIEGRRVHPRVQALAVPGSAAVARQAQEEGLVDILVAAGFEWRLPGCSMCIAMNDDRAPEGTHTASSSNRNFVNRQGTGVRTHLMSPASVAACAVTGRLSRAIDEQ